MNPVLRALGLDFDHVSSPDDPKFTPRQEGVGLLDTALSVGTSALAQIPAGLAGAGMTLAGYGNDRAADVVNKTTDLLTYAPRTEYGKQAMRKLGLIGEEIDNELIAPAEDVALKHGGKAAPVALTVAAVLANMAGPGKARPRGPGFHQQGSVGTPAARAVDEPLEGLPQDYKVGDVEYHDAGPHPVAREAAQRYMQERGLEETHSEYKPVNEERARRIAEEFDAMKHDPSDPRVQASYRAMIDETVDQWREIEKTGLKVEFIRPDMKDPYGASPRLAIKDVKENNHLWVYPTDSGFGTLNDVTQNPLLEMTDVVIDGKQLRANDVFRIVHDYFGHIKEGVGFRARGEENAWNSHRAMYSPLARGAMTSETRGQNSWVNFGPYGQKNRTASAADTVYADQKTGLLDEEFWKTEDELIDENKRPYFDFRKLTEDPGRTRDIPRYTPPRGDTERAARVSRRSAPFKQLVDWARAGMTDEGLGWYNTEGLRQEFVNEFGEAEGGKKYDRFVDLIAATSARSDTRQNLKTASYYYGQAERGEKAKMPPKGSGYGGKAQKLHFESAAKILAGEQLDPLANPKRATFAENIKGNWKHVTVDSHNVRAIAAASRDPEWLSTRLEDASKDPGPPKWWTPEKHGKWNAKTFNPREFVTKHRKSVHWDRIPPTWFETAPNKTEYKALEELNVRLAQELGVTPAQAQAALWLGAGKRTGLRSPPVALMKVLDERLQITANKRGISKKRALKEMMRGKAPLLQWLGAAPAAGLLALGNEEEDE